VEKFTEVKNLQKVDVAAVQKNALSFFYIVWGLDHWCESIW
jgi:hypothetical protein